MDKEVALKILYVFKAPLVLSPPQEGWEVPKPLRERIIQSRIECVVTGDYDEGLASIADMVIHLWNASLKYPIPGEYVKIYAYYTNKLLDGLLEMNTGILEIPNKLSSYEENLARDLRRKILRVQMRELEKYMKDAEKVYEWAKKRAPKIVEILAKAEKGDGV